MGLGYKRFYNWWTEDFTEDERIILRKVHGEKNADELIEGNIDFKWFNVIVDSLTNRKYKYHKSPVHYLCGFFDVKYPDLSLKLLKMAERIIVSATVMDVHYLYHDFIKLYKATKDLANLRIYCLKQIEISQLVKECLISDSYLFNTKPMSHIGYDLYSDTLIRNNEFDECLRVCIKANSEGWHGNWINKINEIKKLK